jgi:hypothetical protein
VTTWPHGSDRPLASTLNFVEGDTRPNAVIVPIGDGGQVDFYTQPEAHLLADIYGYTTP